jgi:mitochondrial fission protein ELM1
MSGFPRTWALLGDKTGDNNQLLALAEGLGWPFETRTLCYNLARAIPPRNLGATRISLTRQSRALLSPPWPDLILAIGRRSTPAMQWIRRQSPSTKLVLVGHPRVEPERFDLVITTSQYPVAPRPNVLTLPMAMSRLKDPGPPTAPERAFLAELPRPHLLFAVGGPTRYWDLDPSAIVASLRVARKRAEQLGGTLIAVPSRRTPAEITESIGRALKGSRHRLISGPMPRFALLMTSADEIFVTADSVAMLSEAIQTGRPIGMIPVTMSGKGQRVLRGSGESFGWGYGRRDLRRIWQQMQGEGLIGTVEDPVAGHVSGNAVEIAAAAVRALFEPGPR